LAITSLLIQLWIAQYQNGKKNNYTLLSYIKKVHSQGSFLWNFSYFVQNKK
jgi:hypothetical protein